MTSSARGEQRRGRQDRAPRRGSDLRCPLSCITRARGLVQGNGRRWPARHGRSVGCFCHLEGQAVVGQALPARPPAGSLTVSTEPLLGSLATVTSPPIMRATATDATRRDREGQSSVGNRALSNLRSGGLLCSVAALRRPTPAPALFRTAGTPQTDQSGSLSRSGT